MRKILGLNIKPYCTCIVNGTWKPQDGWSLDHPSGLWIHPRCKKPSKMNYERIHLGMTPLPETRTMDWMRDEDIYAKETRLEALKEIEKELDWGDDLD